jgi:hypothetical protein
MRGRSHLRGPVEGGTATPLPPKAPGQHDNVASGLGAHAREASGLVATNYIEVFLPKRCCVPRGCKALCSARLRGQGSCLVTNTQHLGGGEHATHVEQKLRSKLGMNTIHTSNVSRPAHR